MHYTADVESRRGRDRADPERSAYRSCVVRTSKLEESSIAEMSALYLENYAGSNDALFRADLMEKDHALLVFSGNALVGFTTIKSYEVKWQGKNMGIIFSGDTIVAPRHWGQRELAFAWLKHVGSIKTASPDRPLYWFLLVKGHRTYRYLSVFAHHFYPCWQDTEVERLKPLADFLATARYGANYNRQTGIVEFPESRGYLRPAIARPANNELERQDVRFFLARNPGYLQGSELVCVCELALDNLKPLAGRFFQRASGLQQ